MIDDLTDDQADETSNNVPAAPEPDEPEPDDELWDSREACRYFGGGTRPISIATLYRNVGKIYPPPINVSPNVVRWVPSECRQARKRMLAARNRPKPKPAKPRGRKPGRRIERAEADI
jgi:hypothetical protein